jgi:hypothetical protein
LIHRIGSSFGFCRFQFCLGLICSLLFEVFCSSCQWIGASIELKWSISFPFPLCPRPAHARSPCPHCGRLCRSDQFNDVDCQICGSAICVGCDNSCENNAVFLFQDEHEAGEVMKVGE